MSVFIPEIEQLSLDHQQAFQQNKLIELLQYLHKNSSFYQRLFSNIELDISKFSFKNDWQKIPTTSKEQLQTNNWDFLCVPKSKVAEYTITSGTLGAPVTIAMSEQDCKRLAYNEWLSMQHMGINENDIVQLMLTLDKQFMAGMAYYSGTKKTGATVVRVGAGSPQLQWNTIQNYQSTALVAVPSFLIKMLQYNPEHLINNSVKKVLAIGEPIRNEKLEPNVLAQNILNLWDNFQLFGTYASTEMQTAFTECEHGMGGHHHPELIYVELLDEVGNVVAKDEAGEVTISTFGVEAMPLLRYRTGDICRGYYEPCACGRKTLRLGPVLSRKKQMIKYKGTTIYPAAIVEILQQFNSIQDYQIEVSSDEFNQDQVTLHLCCGNDTIVEQELKVLLQAHLRVTPCLQFHTNEQIQKRLFAQESRKPIRFLDKRNFKN